MRLPWTIDTFPKDKPMYIRMKGNPNAGASLIVTIHPFGVNVNLVDKKGKITVQGYSWKDLSTMCEQWNGQPCGVRQ